MDLRVGERPADGHRAGRRDAVQGGPDRGLGRAVDVPQAGPGGEQAVGQLARQRLAAAEDGQPGTPGPPGREKHAPGGGGRLHHRHRRAHQLAQPGAVGGVLTGGDDDAGAGEERQVELEPGDVEGEGGDGEQHVAGAEAGPPPHRGQEVDQSSVADLHSLGTAGRARGVEDVGGAQRPGAARGCRRRETWRDGRDSCSIAVHDQDPGGVARQAVAERPLGEEDRSAGVGEHVGEALGRMLGIEREVGAAGLEHAEEPHQQLSRAFETEADEDLGTDTGGAEAPCEALGPPLQLQVGEPPPGALYRHGVRGAHSLRGDQLVQTGVRGLGLGTVPLLELPALGGGQQRQVREPGLRPVGHAGEKRRELSGEAGHRRAVEEVGVVFPGSEEAARRPAEGERQVELGGDLSGQAGERLQSRFMGHRRGLLRGVLQHQHYLEEG